MRAGVTIVDPGATVIDVEVADRSRRGDRARSRASTATRSSARAPWSGRSAPLIDCRGRPRGEGGPLLRQGAEIGERVSVGPFAYLRPGTVLRAGAKAGTFVEIKNSRIGAGIQGPPPLLHRRRRRGGGDQPRRRHDHRQLRRDPQAPHDDRRPGQDRRRHDAGRPGHRGGRRLHRRGLGDHQGRAARARSGIARERQRNIEGYTERRKEREERHGRSRRTRSSRHPAGRKLGRPRERSGDASCGRRPWPTSSASSTASD